MTGRSPLGLISSVASVIGSLNRCGPALPGVQVEHAVDRFDRWFMRVSGNDYIDVASHGIDVKLFEIAENEDGSSSELHEFGVRVLSRPVTGVDVASDRRDRRDPPKCGQDIRPPDVPAVNDVIGACQTLLRFWPQ